MKIYLYDINYFKEEGAAMKTASKNIMVTLLIFLAVVIGTAFVPEDAFCTNTTYYLSITKTSDISDDLVLSIGEKKEVHYTISVSVAVDKPEGCSVTLLPGECVKVSDDQYGEFAERICYADGPGRYEYSYSAEIGGYTECGDYAVTNTACMEDYTFNPVTKLFKLFFAFATGTPLIEKCCAIHSINVSIPCEEVPYYVTLTKMSDCTDITLQQGKTTEANYTIKAEVIEEKPLKGCYLTLTKNDCIKISDTNYGIFENEICYEDGPGEYLYDYSKQIGPYEACGDYVVENTACMNYSSNETAEPCCADLDITVHVPCAADYYYVTVDKSVTDTDLTLEPGAFADVEYTITVDVTDEEPDEGCYLLLEQGECVKVTDTSNNMFMRTICYANGPGRYEYTYPRKIGGYDACGEYVVSNKACIEIIEAKPMALFVSMLFRLLSTDPPPDTCCSEIEVNVHVPCDTDDLRYITIDKKADYRDITLKRDEIADVTYTITATVSDTKPSELCYLGLQPGECVMITDTLNQKFQKTICYADGTGTYAFSYDYEIGPYAECGNYLIENKACLEYDDCSESCDHCGCCDMAVIRVKVSCDFFCPRSQGYWMNHPEAWPVEELVIGGEIHTKMELLGKLYSPPYGAMEIILIKQLIAAKLNKSAGADTSSIDWVIEEADACLEFGYCSKDELEYLKDKLDRFNNSGDGCENYWYDDDDDECHDDDWDDD